MSHVANWFSRKFEFTFPVALFPNLCARLRGTPARVEETVQNCPRELLIRRPDQKWSIQEHVGHLLDLEPLWSARVDDYLTSKSGLTVADLGNRKTHEANHNARDIKEILGAFRHARSQLMDQIQEMSPELYSRAMEHPRLKQPMRMVDHLYFVAEHDDHHLARIWELVAAARTR